jgi:hypothetical protein
VEPGIPHPLNYLARNTLFAPNKMDLYGAIIEYRAY